MSMSFGGVIIPVVMLSLSILTQGKLQLQEIPVIETDVGADASNTIEVAKSNVDVWEPIRKLLQGWGFTRNYAVEVGDVKNGRTFLYESGDFKMSKRIPTGSTSKWPSAMMFAGLVNDGTVKNLDDLVSKYLPWWTRDQTDPRSTVTFRMLLSFTSGFGAGSPGEHHNTRAAKQLRKSQELTLKQNQTLEDWLADEAGTAAALKCNSELGSVVECARSIYDNVKLIGTPGKVYSYNSNHLQIAAAIAVATTQLGIHEVVKKYLLQPFGMTDSFYLGKNCPDFGGSLITTGNDYGQFLEGLLNYKSLSKDIIGASEQDSTPFLSDFYTLYGNYGFGHFLLCFDSVEGMTDKCRDERTHADPGAFGFIPMIDRKRGYYFQLVAAEVSPSAYPLSGIPEYLAVAIKPHIDAVITGDLVNPMAHYTHNPQFLSLSVADVNYCLECVLHPEHCS